MSKGTFIGYIEDGEKPFDAIARISTMAAQNGYTAYALCCRDCREPYGNGYTCLCTRTERIRHEEWIKKNHPIR